MKQLRKGTKPGVHETLVTPLLNLAEELGNVSQACRVMGLSRDTFYRYKEAADSGGVEALLDKSRRRPNRKNRVDESIETAVLQHAIDFPAHGQVRASDELRKRGISVSPTGVRGVWLRHDLACFKARLKALEARVAADGLVLTESQIVALEKKKHDDEAAGEIETAHPGYLGSQDTFYVGTLKGRLRDECFNEHWFLNLAHAQAVIRRWVREYNQERPKKSLGGLTPATYAKQLIQNTATLTTGL